jgi:lysophospholipase L1-like esterase
MPSQELKTCATLSRFHRRIEECSRHASLGPVTIVAIGDSVTAGAGPEDRVYIDEVYHARLKVMLEQRYPGCAFQVINVAEGGETATGGLDRFDKAVVPHRHDLLIVAYGLNDAATGSTEGIAQYRLAIESFIARSRETSDADILLLTPNMMPLYATDRIPERWKHVTESFIQIQKNGVLAAYADCLKTVGVEQGVAVADVYAAWQKLAALGTDTTLMLVNGLNHPDEAGHRLAAQVIMQVMESAGATA